MPTAATAPHCSRSLWTVGSAQDGVDHTPFFASLFGVYGDSGALGDEWAGVDVSGTGGLDPLPQRGVEPAGKVLARRADLLPIWSVPETVWRQWQRASFPADSPPPIMCHSAPAVTRARAELDLGVPPYGHGSAGYGRISRPHPAGVG